MYLLGGAVDVRDALAEVEARGVLVLDAVDADERPLGLLVVVRPRARKKFRNKRNKQRK